MRQCHAAISLRNLNSLTVSRTLIHLRFLIVQGFTDSGNRNDLLIHEEKVMPVGKFFRKDAYRSLIVNMNLILLPFYTFNVFLQVLLPGGIFFMPQYFFFRAGILCTEKADTQGTDFVNQFRCTFIFFSV